MGFSSPWTSSTALGGEVGEEQGLLRRRIAAAHHHYGLAAVEEAVAGGAGRHAEALELLLGRQAQPLGLGAGGDDQGLGEDFAAGIQLQAERPLRQVRAQHDVADQFGPHMLGLGPHLVHQPGSLDHVGEARIVLHIGGDGQLAARLDARDQHRIQQRPGGIDGGGVAGGAGTDDGAADKARVGHRMPKIGDGGLECRAYVATDSPSCEACKPQETL
jgi:hypothetical protein